METRTASRAVRRPGRPAADERGEAREALLDVAGRLFARQGVSEVPLRTIAGEAGVTAAMVNYYFGGKDGLYDALLERAFATVLERVGALARDGGAEGADSRLAALLGVLTDTFAEKPWVPTLLVREVLVEGGRFRERFIRGYASKMAGLLPELFRNEIAGGRFRNDLDPELAFVSFMGMAVFPFVARPVLEGALGIEYDDEFLNRFAAHTRRLFLEGAQS